MQGMGVPTRQGSRHRQNAPYQRMRTKDGHLMIGAAGQSIWMRCAEALDHPEWCEDPRFATNQQRMQNRAALESAMEAGGATPPSTRSTSVATVLSPQSNRWRPSTHKSPGSAGGSAPRHPSLRPRRGWTTGRARPSTNPD
jgi:hypothetical protein